jgi:hypothetical protein
MPWEFVGKLTNYTKVRVIHRLYTTPHKTILGFADIPFYYINPWYGGKRNHREKNSYITVEKSPVLFIYQNVIINSLQCYI